MSNILKNKDFTNFQFENITLGQPSVQSSSHGFFTRIYNNGEPLFIQTNETSTKDGISSSKKPFIDLMMASDDSILIDFLESLENNIIKSIYQKRDVWFHNPIDLDDIENSFISAYRLYKSGKFYLLRSYFNIINDQYNIFNEHNDKINPSEINETSKLISILEIQGVRFTQKSFKMDIINKQILLLDPRNQFSTCMIKGLGKTESNNNNEENLGKINNDELGENIDIEQKNEIVENENIKNDDENNGEFEILDENDATYSLDDNKQDIDNETINEENSIEEEPKSEEVVEINENIDNNLEIQEIKDLNLDDDETILLKKPNDVYKEIYKVAIQKARNLKQNAIEAYLEAKNIKNSHLLDFSDLSDDSLSDIEY